MEELSKVKAVVAKASEMLGETYLDTVMSEEDLEENERLIYDVIKMLDDLG